MNLSVCHMPSRNWGMPPHPHTLPTLALGLCLVQFIQFLESLQVSDDAQFLVLHVGA